MYSSYNLLPNPEILTKNMYMYAWENLFLQYLHI